MLFSQKKRGESVNIPELTIFLLIVDDSPVGFNFYMKKI